MVSALCASLDGLWWRQEASSRGKNWVWRDKVPSHLTESKEVVLERRLVRCPPALAYVPAFVTRADP
jgi:hypothetical protein